MLGCRLPVDGEDFVALPTDEASVGATLALIMIWAAPVCSSAPSVHRPGGGAEAGAYYIA